MSIELLRKRLAAELAQSPAAIDGIRLIAKEFGVSPMTVQAVRGTLG